MDQSFAVLWHTSPSYLIVLASALTLLSSFVGFSGKANAEAQGSWPIPLLNEPWPLVPRSADDTLRLVLLPGSGQVFYGSGHTDHPPGLRRDFTATLHNRQRQQMLMDVKEQKQKRQQWQNSFVQSRTARFGGDDDYGNGDRHRASAELR